MIDVKYSSYHLISMTTTSVWSLIRASWLMKAESVPSTWHTEMYYIHPYKKTADRLQEAMCLSKLTLCNSLNQPGEIPQVCQNHLKSANPKCCHCSNFTCLLSSRWISVRVRTVYYALPLNFFNSLTFPYSHALSISLYGSLSPSLSLSLIQERCRSHGVVMVIIH